MFFVPYTPQHNGVSKQKKRTLVEVILSMLNYVKFSWTFWGEALFTTINFQNRQLNKTILNLSPYENVDGA